MGPDGGRRGSPTASTGRRGGPTRSRSRKRAPRRPPLARPAAVLTLAVAALVLVGGQLGAWDAILRPNHLANRGPSGTGTPGGDDFGPVVWSPGRDLAERGERVRREGRPIPPAELTGYRWPLEAARLITGYGFDPDGTFSVDGRRFHEGLDLATKCGDPIVAAHAGIVLAAGRDHDEHQGWLGDLTVYRERLDRETRWETVPIAVVIDDGNGYRSVYAHLKSVVVQAGQRVAAGQLLGYEGRTGGADRCHLHYAIFSPHETASLRLVRRIADRTGLPGRLIARIDPLLVLPPPETAGIRPRD